jgi:hypothetical protein
MVKTERKTRDTSLITGTGLMVAKQLASVSFSQRMIGRGRATNNGDNSEPVFMENSIETTSKNVMIPGFLI